MARDEQVSSDKRQTMKSLLWQPHWTKWDSSVNYELTWGLSVFFGLVASISVANLYYTHPILHILAKDFNVSDEDASLIPTVLQAGYAGGLLFIIPVGDIVRRRWMIIALMFVTSMVWLGCTLTKNFSTFLGLSFIVGLLTVTPQLMFPLAVRYAPLRHRPTMTAIVMAGLVFGILVARLVSGIVTEFTSWRNVYWISFGFQVLALIPCILFLPDFPVLLQNTSYLAILLKIIKMPFQQPLLIQQALIAFLIMAMFTSFWTTLTFQLSGVFHLSTLVIGLFALVGMSPILLSPIISRVVMTRIHPTGTLILGHLLLMLSVCIGTFVGNFSIGGLVIWAALGDLGMNIVVVSNRMAIANIEPTAQNAVNSIYMVITFCGQLFGTAIGNKVYSEGGWIPSGCFSIGMVGGGLVLTVVRGPHERGWLGWRGGWELRKSKLASEGQEGQPAVQVDEEIAPGNTENSRISEKE